MCFSATASFSASLVIGTIGVATFSKSKDSNLKFLGAIPFLFAVQQFTEGFVWLSFNNFNFQFIQETATKAFLFFAWVLWPILMPYSIYKTEIPGLKKKINFYLFLLGSASGLHSIYTLLAGNPQPLVNDFHIDYTVSASAFENKIQIIQQLTYVIVTVVPLFVSSLKGAKVLATANFIALVLAFVFFKHSLPSTWCFFAAILSGIIYWIVRVNSKKTIAQFGLTKKALPIGRAFLYLITKLSLNHHTLCLKFTVVDGFNKVQSVCKWTLEGDVRI